MIFYKKHKFTKAERGIISDIVKLIERKTHHTTKVIKKIIEDFLEDNYENANYQNIKELKEFLIAYSGLYHGSYGLRSLQEDLSSFFSNDKQRSRTKIILNLTRYYSVFKEIALNENITEEEMIIIHKKLLENDDKKLIDDIGQFIFFCKENEYTTEDIIWLIDKKIFMIIPKGLSIKRIDWLLDKGYKREDLKIFRDENIDFTIKIMSKYSREDSLKILAYNIPKKVLEFYVDKDFAVSEIIHAYTVHPEYSLDSLKVIFEYNAKTKEEFIKKYC